MLGAAPRWPVLLSCPPLCTLPTAPPLAVWASFISMIVSSHAIRRYTGSKQAGARWFFFILCTAQSLTFYTFLLPM